MPLTWEEIDESWLGHATGHADPPEVIVDGFDRVERFFGRDWLQEMHGGGRGLHNALMVATLGKQLKVLEEAPGCSNLVRRLRERSLDARAELHAMWIAWVPSPDSAAVESEPAVEVAGRRRRPDFRLGRRDADDPEWTYVEVTRANEAHAERSLREAVSILDAILDEVTGTYAVAVVFHVQPSPEQVEETKSAAAALCRAHEPGRTELARVATVVFAEDEGIESIRTDDIQPATARLASTRTRMEGHVVRQISVSVPYLDERSLGFLESEASQLPDTHPGLVMISINDAPGALSQWPAILQDHLELGLHDNVSAICLFEQGFTVLDAGFGWFAQTAVVRNPTAARPLPPWLLERLKSWRRPRA